MKLSFACGQYDRTEALRTGEVKPEGIELDYVPIQAPREIFDRMVGNLEFDVSEFSASEFITMVAANSSPPFVALPVFPSRMFRLGFIYINKHAGIRTPKDLEGKRIGVPHYTQTAAVWIRGYLSDKYAIDFDTIRWVQGAVEHCGPHGKPRPLQLLKPVNIEENDSGRSLGELLVQRRIDALIGSRQPEHFRREPNIVRLFPDYRAMEKNLLREAALFPIMHLLVIRRDIYERNRWIASSLYNACVEAKDQALARMRFSGSLCSILPWQLAEMEEIDELFGGDPWPYGIEANRPTLETLVRYLFEQRFIPCVIPIEYIFAPDA